MRQVIAGETQLRKDGTQFVDEGAEARSSVAWRDRLNSEGSPSQAVSGGWHWTPGTEPNHVAGAAAAADAAAS